MTRAERVQELRDRLGDHAEPNAFERLVDNGDGTLTVVELTDDGVRQHRVLWTPPTDEDNDQ